MSKGFASSLTEAGLRLNRSSTWRRVGSASARKTPSMDVLVLSVRGRTAKAPLSMPAILRNIPKYMQAPGGSNRVRGQSVHLA